MDLKAIEQLIGEQYKGKEKLFSSNVHALHLGRDWALQNLKCPIGLRIKKADKVGDRIVPGIRSRPRLRSPTPSPAIAGGCATIPRPRRPNTPSSRARTSSPRSAS
jgi:hypothetical protein